MSYLFRSIANPEARLFHMLAYNYGNLFYSIFRKAALFNNSGTIIESIDFEIENEIPILLFVSASGNFRVLPEVGFYKKTTPQTYLQARWEVEGGILPNAPILNLTHAYHQRALNAIKKTIDLLPVPSESIIKARDKSERVIWGHYAYMANGYKEARK